VGGTVAAVGPLTAAQAFAAPSYKAASYPKTPIASAATRHLVNRFSYGMTPALEREVRRAGGAAKWFERQLATTRISDPFADRLATWWVSINASASTIWRRDQSGVEPGWVAMANYARWCLLRRIYSNRQVLEVMTEFWENHLHVPVLGSAHMVYRSSYGKAIRKYALGRFDEMLYASTTHPAMGIFLDNAVSTAKAPNENLGRELLELHTVGAGNYTEDDVKNSARILTGWRVDEWKTWDATYDPASHWTGRVKVLGFSDPNASTDGRTLTKAYLKYLAHHPLTAQQIARKLAIRFVSDAPSASLVNRLATIYLDNDTEIKPVLRALVRTPEFKAAINAKVRTPIEDVVATYRSLGVKVSRPRGDTSTANAILWQTSNLGMMPFAWPRPDGQPDSNLAWSSASRLLGSFDIHYTMSGGWWPKVGATYRKPATWVPEFPLRFDCLVDHLSRTLLGRRSTDALLKACCQATGTSPREKITRTHPLIRWKMPRLLTTVLDTPAHMTR
jgi:hypothetical protein